MSRPVPRRPASSRGPTPRPRRLAGHAAPGDPGSDAPTDGSGEDLGADLIEEPTGAPSDEAAPDPADAAGPGGPSRLAALASGVRTTMVLIGVLAVLGLGLAAAGITIALDDSDAPAVAAGDERDAGAGPEVPAGRPVVAGELQVRDGVEAAAKAAQEIVSVDYRNYDDEVAAARKLMTDDFGEQYEATAREIQDGLVAKQTTVQATVVAQGVVRSSRTRLEALVFLNQVVSRLQEGKPDTLVTPYKVLVTMVHTDRGWFVDRLDTDDPSAAPAPTGDPSSSPAVPSPAAP